MVQNFADKGELVQANFKQGGGIEWPLITEVSRQSGSGTWSIDIECTVKATVQEPYRLGLPTEAGPTNLSCLSGQRWKDNVGLFNGRHPIHSRHFFEV